MRASSSGKLRSLNQPPAPRAGPGPEASSGKKGGGDTHGERRAGGSRDPVHRPAASSRRRPACCPPAARAPRASAAPCARPAARAPGAARRPRPQAGALLLPYPLFGAPAAGRPRALAAASLPRPALAPGPAPLPAACACASPPPIRSGWLSSAAVTAARPSGGALRPLPLITPVAHRGAQAPPSQRAGPGVSAAVPVGKAALGGARRVGAPRGPGGESAVASQARWSRGSGRDGSCGSLRPNAQAAAVGSSRKGAPFPRVGKGGARSALSRTRATPARAGWPGWVGFVRSLAVTRQGHTWSVGSRSQLEDLSGVVFVFTIGVI